MDSCPPSSSAYTWKTSDAFPPCLVDSLCGWKDHHTHVLPDVAAHLYVETPEQSWELATELEDLHIRLEIPWSSWLRPRNTSKRLRPIQIVGESIQWVDTARCFRLSWTRSWGGRLIIQARNKANQKLSVLDPLNISGLPNRNSVLFYIQLIRPNGLCVHILVVRSPHQRFSAVWLTQLGTLVTKKFTTTGRFRFWRTTSEN